MVNQKSSATQKIFIVAGEASADTHASLLVKQLLSAHPGLRFFGVGGKQLRDLGVELIASAHQLNVVGTTDWMNKAGEVWRTYRKVVERIEKDVPDVAILLDLPDFNLRLAKRLKKRGVPVVYYISPQVWAWRRYRLKTIRKYVDRMLVVFPFEKEFYDKHGIESVFVGHPLIEECRANFNTRDRSIRLESPRVALLPGSRRSELHYHGHLVRQFITEFKAKYPHCQFRIPVAQTLTHEEVRDAVGNEAELVDCKATDVYEWCDFALVASGTATLEAGLTGVPFALFYKVSQVSNLIYRFYIRWKKCVGLPNILHQREVAREFFQSKATVENLVTEGSKLLEDDGYRDLMIAELKQCRSLLGSRGASERAATEVVNVLERASSLVDREVLGGVQSPAPA